MSDNCDILALKKIVDEQRAQIIELEKRVNAATKLADDAENYSRQDCLILRGALEVRPGVSLRVEVTRLIWNHTGVQIEPWCLNTVHWLNFGKSLIIRFNNKEVRNKIYSNRIPKDRMRRGLYIHECLSNSKVKLVEKCVTLKRNREIQSYWTQNGQVFVKSEKDLPPILLVSEWSIEDIRAKIASQPKAYSEAVRAKTNRSAAPGPSPHEAGKQMSGGVGVSVSAEGGPTKNGMSELKKTSTVSLEKQEGGETQNGRNSGATSGGQSAPSCIDAGAYPVQQVGAPVQHGDAQIGGVTSCKNPVSVISGEDASGGGIEGASSSQEEKNQAETAKKTGEGRDENTDCDHDSLDGNLLTSPSESSRQNVPFKSPSPKSERKQKRSQRRKARW